MKRYRSKSLFGRLPATFVGILLAVGVIALPAHANNCASAARSVAASQNAEVLSVKAQQTASGTVCVVTLRIPGRGGNPPRVETVRVNG